MSWGELVGNLILFGLILIILLLLSIAFILRAVNKRQEKIKEQIGTLDLTGREFRRSLKELEQSAQERYQNIHQILNYSPQNSNVLNSFKPIQQQSECLFAKKAVLWASPEWEDSLSFEENIKKSIPALHEFCSLGRGLHLDGFLLQIHGTKFTQTLNSFACSFAKALTLIASSDTRGPLFNCLKRPQRCKDYGWWFELNGEFLFVTSFAPFYPKNSSRYQFGSNPSSAFILFQPEYSFAWHNVECDPKVQTNWNQPDCIRDQIRIKFRDAGRNYIGSKDEYIQPPSGQDMVKPLKLDDPIVDWWNHCNHQHHCQ